MVRKKTRELLCPNTCRSPYDENEKPSEHAACQLSDEQQGEYNCNNAADYCEWAPCQDSVH